MRHLSTLAALCGLLAFPLTAQAHFVWLIAEGNGHVELVFSETPYELTAPHLRKLMAPMQAHKGEAQVPLEATAQGRSGRLVEPAGPAHLAHTYGLFGEGEERFLLSYYAKGASTWEDAQATCGLRAEVTAVRDGEELVATVRFDGEPVAGAEVVVAFPDRFEVETFEADAEGRVRLPAPPEGLLGIRTHAVEDAPGEHEGAAYAQVKHYTTLTISADPADAIPEGANPTAWRQLQQATLVRATLPREVQAVSGSLTYADGAQRHPGTFRYTVSEGFTKLEVQGVTEEQATWLRNTLAGMLAHRLHRPFTKGDGRHPVTYAETPPGPRGIELTLNDPANTRYTLEDGEFVTIDRDLPAGSFSLLVLDTEFTAEGRGLGTYYVVTYREGEAITQVDAYSDSFRDVDGVMLPKARQVVTQDAEGTRIRVLQLTDVELE